MKLNIYLVAAIVFMNSAWLESRQSSNNFMNSRQLIVVTTNEWGSVVGVLRRYERNEDNQSWKAIGEEIPVNVGRNGMAWGRGLHVEKISDSPVKKEGDGKAPAGIFSLSLAFGYTTKAEAGAVKLPYVQATPTLECVDDSQSANYNKVLDRKSVGKPDWKSSEQMRRQDEQYRWGVVVDHNSKGEPGCGSCIFLHIWAGPGKGTAGCTAMEARKMEEVMNWLDSAKNPLLVQLPAAEYRGLRQAWGLPIE